MYFGEIKACYSGHSHFNKPWYNKALQKHKRCCGSRVGNVVRGEKSRIWPTRIVPRFQRVFLCVMGMQKHKLHAVDDVDTWGWGGGGLDVTETGTMSMY